MTGKLRENGVPRAGCKDCFIFHHFERVCLENEVTDIAGLAVGSAQLPTC